MDECPIKLRDEAEGILQVEHHEEGTDATKVDY